MSASTAALQAFTHRDVGPDEPETIWFLQNLMLVRVSGEQTGGRYSLVECHAPAGDTVPLHRHTRDDEAFYVLEGELTVWVGDTVRTLEPGESALAPIGVPHVYKVTSDGPARWLVTCSPAGFEQFLAGYGEPAAERRLPDPTAPDVDRLGRLAAEHGIELLGPPGTLPS